MDTEKLLEQLNKFTRREHTADEVYIFTVTLCDNEIDRDSERFSRKSLEEMAEKFVGVTGIFDHDPKGENQTARIFMTEVAEEPRDSTAGEPYAYLKGYAYMVRTEKNADLIREIDGGIKKEVSVSCAAERHICSLCGANRRVDHCRHVKGKVYGGKKCFVTLEDISDAYEWSFVAVPAQVRAGVTKTFSEAVRADNTKDKQLRTDMEERICRALNRDDRGGAAETVFKRVRDKLEDSELGELCGILAAGKPVPKQTGNCEEYMTDKEGLYGRA